jgi:hypothetical protein
VKPGLLHCEPGASIRHFDDYSIYISPDLVGTRGLQELENVNDASFGIQNVRKRK